MAAYNTLITSQVGHLSMLKVIVLTIGAFSWKVYYGVVPSYASARIRQESNSIGEIGPLGFEFLDASDDSFTILDDGRV